MLSEKIKNILNKNNICFWGCNIYIFLLIIIPKNFSTLFNIIPMRLFLACSLIFIYIIDRIVNSKNYKKHNKYLIFIYTCFLLFCIPSLFVSTSFITSLYTLIKFLVGFLIFDLFYTKRFNKNEYKILLKTVLFSTIFVLLYGIVQNIFDFGLQKIGIEKYPPANGRSVSSFFNTIYFGIYINLVLSFTIYKMYQEKITKNKILYSILFIILYGCMMLTYTRSAFLIFCGIIFIIFVFCYKMIINKFLIICLLICIGITFVIPGSTKLISSAINDGFSIVLKFDVLKQFLPNISNKNDGDGSKDKNESPSEDNNNEESGNESENNPLNNNENPNNNNGNINEGNGNESGNYPLNNNGNPNNNGNNNEGSGNSTSGEIIFEDLSLEHRKEFAIISNRVAHDNKFTGVGFGTYIDYMGSQDFKTKYPDYKGDITHPHSSIVLLYSEVGIFAQILYILFYLSIVILSIKFLISNRKNDKIYPISVVMFSTLIGFMVVNIISENAVYDSQIYYIFFVFVGLLSGYLKNHENKRVLFISSTGGHLNELMQLKSMFKKYDSHIITEKTKSNIELKKTYKDNIDYLVYGTKDHKLSYIFKFSWNFIKSIYLYFKIVPTHIVTTGTHTAVPICYIGKLFGSKIIFIETFANVETKTLSGKLVYPISDLFIVQWENMIKLYPKAICLGWIY